ncbi:hypothetical protein KKB18_00255 [bacterium]|nr:hypothetical protein [bacterium]
MRNIKNSKVKLSALIILASLTILSMCTKPALSRDYDFSLTLSSLSSAIKVEPASIVDFYVEFKNDGTMDDSFMFYCNMYGSDLPMGLMATGCFEDVCWGDQTYQPEPFAAGESEEIHVQIYTPETPTGTFDAFLKVESEGGGITKMVNFTISTLENPMLHILIYTNQNTYQVGDNLMINLRTVNFGLNQNADTYAVLVSGENAFFFKLREFLQLSTEPGPYTRNIFYGPEFVDDATILDFPLESDLGVDQLTLGAAMADVGTANLITDVSVATIYFE